MVERRGRKINNRPAIISCGQGYLVGGLFKKIRGALIAAGILLVAVGVVWYVGFERDISFPSLDAIQKIEVCQNDFKQRAQQITYIEEKPKILKIYEFLYSRKKGWQPLLYSPAEPMVTVDFYGSKGVMFKVYLMKSSNFLLSNSNGNYIKSLRNEEISQIYSLLGVQMDRLIPVQNRKS